MLHLLLFSLTHNMPSHTVGYSNCPRALIPLFSLFFGIAVTLGLRYGYYGNCGMLLGPKSLRMIEISSVFVEQLWVRDEAKKGMALYEFLEKPVLSLVTNWTASNHLFIDSYGRGGFSMWLNRGSKIRMTWEMNYTDGQGLVVILMKGYENFEEVKKYLMGSKIYAKSSGDGIKEAEYDVEDDDSYYLGLLNLDPRNVETTLKVNVSSKTYDISKSTSICSTTTDSCKISLVFPQTRYFVLTMDNNDVTSRGWDVELSFTARMNLYFIFLGYVVVAVYVVLKFLEACENEEMTVETCGESETDPILPRKEVTCTYGTMEEDQESNLRYSSEDSDGRMCIICYDESINCFLAPCGHATCYTCAQRIMEQENNLCPICRRPISKARRLCTC